MVIRKSAVLCLSCWNRFKQSTYALPVAAVINTSLAVSMFCAANGKSVIIPGICLVLVATLTLALTNDKP